MASTSRFSAEVLEQLLALYEKPEDILGKDGILAELKKALMARGAQSAGVSYRLLPYLGGV